MLHLSAMEVAMLDLGMAVALFGVVMAFWLAY